MIWGHKFITQNSVSNTLFGGRQFLSFECCLQVLIYNSLLELMGFVSPIFDLGLNRDHCMCNVDHMTKFTTINNNLQVAINIGTKVHSLRM